MSGPRNAVEQLDPNVEIRVVEAPRPEIIEMLEDHIRNGWVIRYSNGTQKFIDRYAFSEEDQREVRAFRYLTAHGRPAPSRSVFDPTSLAIQRPELIARIKADPVPAKAKPKKERKPDLWSVIEQRLRDASEDRAERYRAKRRGTRVVGDYGLGGGAARPRMRRLAKAV